jgi:uncharacterized protein (TIGR03000 family)
MYKTILTASVIALACTPIGASAQSPPFGPTRPGEGTLIYGNRNGYYGTNLARRLNFYSQPQIHWLGPSYLQYTYNGPLTLERLYYSMPVYATTYLPAPEEMAPTYTWLNGAISPTYTWLYEPVMPTYTWLYGPDAPTYTWLHAAYPTYTYLYGASPTYTWLYGTAPSNLAEVGRTAPPNYTATNGNVSSSQDTKAVTSASLKVYAPNNSAQVWVNGTKATMKGSQTEFVTPELPAGKTMDVEVRVQWTENGKEVTRTRATTVRGGAQLVWAFYADTNEKLPPPDAEKK